MAAPERSARRPPARRRRPAAAAEPMLVCPNCGSTLTERKCKLLCPNALCGYFLSCADYY